EGRPAIGRQRERLTVAEPYGGRSVGRPDEHRPSPKATAFSELGEKHARSVGRRVIAFRHIEPRQLALTIRRRVDLDDRTSDGGPPGEDGAARRDIEEMKTDWQHGDRPHTAAHVHRPEIVARRADTLSEPHFGARRRPRELDAISAGVGWQRERGRAIPHADYRILPESKSLFVEREPASVGRDPDASHDRGCFVADGAERELDQVLAADPPDDGQLRSVG